MPTPFPFIIIPAKAGIRGLNYPPNAPTAIDRAVRRWIPDQVGDDKAALLKTLIPSP